MRRHLVSLICVMSSVVCQIPKDATAHHPDGTPIFPEELRQVLREALAAGRGVPSGIREHVEGDNLQAFVDAVQAHNYQRLFEADGSAVDVAEWRKMFAEDAKYNQLFLEQFPDQWRTIMSGSDEEVQEVLREQSRAAKGMKAEL